MGLPLESMSLKRRISKVEELPDSLAQMTISSKRIMLDLDILPPIQILEYKSDLPPMTLNPESSQLVLYKSITLIDQLKENQEIKESDPNEKSKNLNQEIDMDWE